MDSDTSAEQKEWRRDYRKRVRQSTPKPELFPLRRLIVTLILSGGQFGSSILRHRWNPKSPPPQVGNEVLIFALVTIVIFMVMYALEWSWNYVVLAPMIVDGKDQAKIDAQADEIASLKEQSELSKKRKEIGIEFAALMRQEVDLRQRLKSALDGDEFTKLIREADDWVNQTVGVLKEAGLPTDAEAFYQVGPIELSSEQLERFAHVAEWKRDVIARLALYRQTLDQIKENRRL